MEIRKLRVAVQLIFLAIWNMGVAPWLKTGLICPVLYCYGCPLASFACPIGVLQNFIVFHRLPLYLAGSLGVYGAIAGRGFCGWACPFGALQELLGAVKGRRFRPRPRWYVKYVFLALVLAATWLTVDTIFCKLCPSGGLFAAIPYRLLNPHTPMGVYFQIHMLTLAVAVALFVLAGRIWCSYICPVASLLGPLNRLSLITIRLDEEKCTRCGRCLQKCPMNIEKLEDIGVSTDCIRCGVCVEECPTGALSVEAP